MANYLSLKYSPHWFLDGKIFQPAKNWDTKKHLISKIHEEVERARKHGRRFVKHYFDRYDNPLLPPSWAISECVPFGLWSKTYANLQSNKDKKTISNRFAVTQTDVFQSWIHALTVIRNVVAHHGQLLRVRHGVSPANYKNKGIRFTDPKSFFAIATVIHYLLSKTNLPNQWKPAIKAIFKKYPEIDIQELNFPPSWENFPGWE